MSPSTHTDRPPTPRQLRYLRFLAEKTGTSFTYPSSFGQARSELDRLERLKHERGTYREPRKVDEGQFTYATEVQPAELSGFGSDCQWSH
jgi:hypothetical protein